MRSQEVRRALHHSGLSRPFPCPTRSREVLLLCPARAFATPPPGLPRPFLCLVRGWPLLRPAGVSEGSCAGHGDMTVGRPSRRFLEVSERVERKGDWENVRFFPFSSRGWDGCFLNWEKFYKKKGFCYSLIFIFNSVTPFPLTSNGNTSEFRVLDTKEISKETISGRRPARPTN